MNRLDRGTPSGKVRPQFWSYQKNVQGAEVAAGDQSGWRSSLDASLSVWLSRGSMPTIASLEAGFYRIPLPVVLTDSTHGEMRDFELNTVRVRDADGAEGVGYTYTVGRNGAAVDAILRLEIAELLAGADADLIERLWQKMWWELHYGGRGGPVVLAMSAVDIALGDLKAKRAGLPLWNLLGGHDPRVPCYAGGIDLDLPLDELLRQTDDNLG